MSVHSKKADLELHLLDLHLDPVVIFEDQYVPFENYWTIGRILNFFII